MDFIPKTAFKKQVTKALVMGTPINPGEGNCLLLKWEGAGDQVMRSWLIEILMI